MPCLSNFFMSNGRAILSLGLPKAWFLAVGQWLAVISCSLHIYDLVVEKFRSEYLHALVDFVHSVTWTFVLGILFTLLIRSKGIYCDIHWFLALQCCSSRYRLC